MNKSIFRASAAAAVAVAILAPLSAAAQEDPGVAPAPEPPLRDPTGPSQRAGPPVATDARDAAPPAEIAPPRMPVVVLRALVVAKGRPGVALVEIDSVTYRVELGAQVSTRTESVAPVTFEVTALTADEVRLTTSPGGRVVVLR